MTSRSSKPGFLQRSVGTKGSLKNHFTFWTPKHPVRLRCKNSEYPDMLSFHALPAGRLNAQNCHLIISRILKEAYP